MELTEKPHPLCLLVSNGVKMSKNFHPIRLLYIFLTFTSAVVSLLTLTTIKPVFNGHCTSLH